MTSKSQREWNAAIGGGFYLGGAAGLGISLVSAPFFLGFWGCVMFVPGLTILGALGGVVLAAFAASYCESEHSR